VRADSLQRRKIMKKNHYPTVKRLAAGVAILGIALGARSVQSLQAKESNSADTAEPLRRQGEQLIVPEKSPLRHAIMVARIDSLEVSTAILLPAAVEADPARLARVLPPLPGRIVSLNKQLGDTVKAGDVLFTIDSADLAQASADAAKAQAALELASRNLERQAELDRSDIAAKRDLDQARSDQAQAASEAARAAARLTQLGARGKAGHLLDVRSPVSGRVTELAAVPGAYWNDSTAAVMTVADLSQVFITANAQEKDLGELYAGQSASIKLDAYPEAMTAKVRFVGDMLDADTRTVKVRMMLDNRDGRLKPGMFAEASLFARPHSGLLVPMTAIVQSGFDSRVFVETAPWQFKPRVVTLGAQSGDKIEIAGGLNAGERVVVRDGVLLND
jgi:cobalt-zinc-cadmium efflux system membrane fusion protein